MQIFMLSRKDKMLHIYDGDRVRKIMIIGDFKNEGPRVLNSMAEDGDIIITTDERIRFYKVNHKKEDYDGQGKRYVDNDARGTG